MNKEEIDSYISENIERVDGMLWCNRAKYFANVSFFLSEVEDSGMIKSFSMKGTVDNKSSIVHITIIRNDDSVLDRCYLIYKKNGCDYCELKCINCDKK